MRVVLDANVVVAAFASHGLCEAVFELCLASHELLISDALLQEVSRSLIDKIRIPESVAGRIVGLLRDNGEIFAPLPVPPKACRDPGDLHILGLVQAGRADCLITGDGDLLALKEFAGCRILTPRQYSDWIHGENRKIS